MSLSTKSISPAVMVAVLLSACGGGDGSGEGGKAASSSPKTAVIATSSIHTGTGDVASRSNTGTSVTPVSTPATGTKTSIILPTGGQTVLSTDTAVAQKLAVQDRDRKAAIFQSRKLRGDALSTMLDATTPVGAYSRTQARDVYDDQGNIIGTIVEEKWDDYSVEFLPVDESNNIIRESGNYPRIEAGSNTTPNFYSPAREIEGHNTEGMKKYEPAQGEYILNVYSKPIGDYSAESVYSFQAVTLTLIANGSKKSLSLPDRLVLTLGGDPFNNYWVRWMDQSVLHANTKRVISHRQRFLENETIQTWESSRAKVRLFWRAGQDDRDVQVCYEISYNLDSYNPAKRLHCSLWTIQEGWSYGHRFGNGGVYIEDTPNIPGSVFSTFRWQGNGTNIDIDIG